jgi:hypothetical protein
MSPSISGTYVAVWPMQLLREQGRKMQDFWLHNIETSLEMMP